MRRLKPRIDQAIAHQVQAARNFNPVPQTPPTPLLSLDHIPIIELEQMDRVVADEVMSCVSFISGTLLDDFAPTPD
jgi:hypothetical protein